MKQYVVDTFTDTIFKGNPATVCILEDLKKDELVAYSASQHQQIIYNSLSKEIEECGYYKTVDFHTTS